MPPQISMSVMAFPPQEVSAGSLSSVGKVLERSLRRLGTGRLSSAGLWSPGKDLSRDGTPDCAPALNLWQLAPFSTLVDLETGGSGLWLSIEIAAWLPCVLAVWPPRGMTTLPVQVFVRCSDHTGVRIWIIAYLRTSSMCYIIVADSCDPIGCNFVTSPLMRIPQHTLGSLSCFYLSNIRPRYTYKASVLGLLILRTFPDPYKNLTDPEPCSPLIPLPLALPASKFLVWCYISFAVPAGEFLEDFVAVSNVNANR